jgi:hypothetical protein
MGVAHRAGWALLALALALAAAVDGVLSGCGTPGAPQPPSLNLPNRVEDLAATRAGGVVSLTWTVPKKNTDRLRLKGVIAARVCRREKTGACLPAGTVPQLAPGATASFTDRLPPALMEGEPRTLTYVVELTNRNGRSAGPSNPAMVLAGKAPAPIADLRLEVRKAGVVLHWTPDATTAAVRLERTLLTPPKGESSSAQGVLAPEPEPLQQNLLVDNDAQLGRALDKSVRFGETYEYRAQRVVRVEVGSQTLELAGELSEPQRVEVRDIFPPAVPTGLAAVATLPAPDAAETHPSIDLSWQPDTEADLAGYVVYRRESGSDWQRISPPQPVVAPAFHDASVAPGSTYIYAVSAIDQTGHESARSAEARETVPSQ